MQFFYFSLFILWRIFIVSFSLPLLSLYKYKSQYDTLYDIMLYKYLKFKYFSIHSEYKNDNDYLPTYYTFLSFIN
jgi:hypothetical protein